MTEGTPGQPGASVVERALRSDRAIVLTGIVVLTGLAWGYLVSMGSMTMAPDVQGWSLHHLLALFVMWSVMMVAMMLPSAAPMILLFATVHRRRRQQQRAAVPTAIFLLGYLAVWTGYSVVSAGIQWVLHQTALLSPTMVSATPLLGGSLLVAAGFYQWTPLKDACLTECRSPLGFLTSEWREGRTGTLIMGIRHGHYCVGCCWILMALLFVAGVMNLLWVAALAFLVLVEKLAPAGGWLARATGVPMIGWGLWLLVEGVP